VSTKASDVYGCLKVGDNHEYIHQQKKKIVKSFSNKIESNEYDKTHLTDVSMRHIVDPESLVADTFFGIFLWVDVDVTLGSVKHVCHVDAQQIGKVLHSLAGACS
jgi:hypothetical protein